MTTRDTRCNASIAGLALATLLVGHSAAAQQATSGPDTVVARLEAPAEAPTDTSSDQQVPAPAPPARPRVTVTSGMDAASSYMFRGIYQEDRGVVAPAFLDVRVPIYRGTGAMTAVRANVGTWDSFHSGPTGAEGRGNAWYEADYYASITATAGRWSPSVIVTALTSPNDAFGTVYEVGAALDFDDSASRLPLAPRVFVVAEVAGQADAGTVPGRYIEASIRPSRPLGSSGPMSFGVAMPVKTGASVRGYYESSLSGSPLFASAGLVPSMTVAGPRVTVELHAGLELMRLGVAPSAFNGGQRTKPIVTIGASVTY